MNKSVASQRKRLAQSVFAYWVGSFHCVAGYLRFCWMLNVREIRRCHFDEAVQWDRTCNIVLHRIIFNLRCDECDIATHNIKQAVSGEKIWRLQKSKNFFHWVHHERSVESANRAALTLEMSVQSPTAISEKVTGCKSFPGMKRCSNKSTKCSSKHHAAQSTGKNTSVSSDILSTDVTKMLLTEKMKPMTAGQKVCNWVEQ